MANDPKIPLAARAPPRPGASIPWLWIAGTGFLTACLVGPCGLGIGLWFGGRMGAGAVVEAGKVTEGAKAGNVTKPTEKWNFQDIQDHLASKGIHTSRGAVDGGGMFFIEGDGTPINMRTSGLEEAVMRGMSMSVGQGFLVTELSSPDAARKGAARFKDESQRDAIAWSRFVIRGSPVMLANLKKALP